MFFYFIHCSLGTQPGSAVGKKGIRRETAKKSASEAHRAVDWGGKSAAELRQPPPFPLPKLPLAIFFFFFFGFFLSLRSLVPGYIHVPEKRLTTSQAMEKSCPVKTGSAPAESTASVYVLKTLAPLPKPRADNNACACSDMP